MFLRSQSNSLYTAISEQGLNRHDFVLTNKNELIITHIQSEYYFRISTYEVSVSTSSNKELRLQILFTPNYRVAIPTKGESQISSIKTWADLLSFFNQWITWLKSEVEQPDLWAELEQTPDIMIEDAEIVEDRFTPTEIKLLKERVIEAEARVITLNLPQQAESVIVEALREMPTKAKRLTKKEVWDVFFGTVVRESLRAGLTSEHTSDIMKTRYQLFHSPIQ